MIISHNWQRGLLHLGLIHTQAPAQILFNAFLPKHLHREGTLNAPAQAHDQIKIYFPRRKELERKV